MTLCNSHELKTHNFICFILQRLSNFDHIVQSIFNILIYVHVLKKKLHDIIQIHSQCYVGLIIQHIQHEYEVYST